MVRLRAYRGGGGAGKDDFGEPGVRVNGAKGRVGFEDARGNRKFGANFEDCGEFQGNRDPRGVSSQSQGRSAIRRARQGRHDPTSSASAHSKSSSNLVIGGRDIAG